MNRKTTDIGAGLVLFDGMCGLCDRSVQFILKHERDAELRFAPLQAEPAAALRHSLNIPPDVDSIVFVFSKGEEIGFAVRSKAVFSIASHLKIPWRWLRFLSILPAGPLDKIYDWVANNRSRFWGRFDTCRIPDTKHQHRFFS